MELIEKLQPAYFIIFKKSAESNSAPPYRSNKPFAVTKWFADCSVMK
jgi:hypothetical protein